MKRKKKKLFQEAQGYIRTKSNSRLVYNYADCSQDKNSSKNKSPHGKREIKEASITSKMIQTTDSLTKCPVKFTSCKTGQSRTPEMLGKSSSIQESRHKMGGYNGPPKNAVQSPGSVLSKASLFETKNAVTKTKDPAEMTLSERMAFFEKNKGEALIPKAPLSSSVPTKKLTEQRDKSPALNISGIYMFN